MHSAKWRLLTAYAFVVGVVIVLFGGALIAGLNYSFDKTLKNSMEMIATDIRNDALQRPLKISSIIDVKEQFPLSPVYIEVYRDTGNGSKRILWTKNMKNHRLPKLENSEFKEIEIPFISTDDETSLLVKRSTIGDKAYTISVATPIDNIDDTIETFIGWLLFTGALLYAIALILGYRMITQILLPVDTITETAKIISRKSLSKRVPLPERHDEFYRLAETFNTMLERLETAFGKIDRFNADLSHELKTPLTIIRGEIEVTMMKERNEKEYQTVLGSILEETQTLQSIIETMLLLSKSDNETLKKRMVPIALDKLVLEAAKEKKRQAEEKSIDIGISHMEAVTIKAEPTLLKRAVVNLIDNALKYSLADTVVEIGLEKENDGAVLTVLDQGYGIAPDQIEMIFDPFYRIDTSHAKTIPGHGLGLPIVQWIAILHDAKIDIKSEPGKGSVFKIYFRYA